MLPGVVVMFVPCMLFLKVLFGEGLSGKLDHFQEALACSSGTIKPSTDMPPWHYQAISRYHADTISVSPNAVLTLG